MAYLVKELERLNCLQFIIVLPCVFHHEFSEFRAHAACSVPPASIMRLFKVFTLNNVAELIFFRYGIALELANIHTKAYNVCPCQDNRPFQDRS